MNAKTAATALPLIPLDNLRLSPSNARKTTTRDVEDLAASIATPEIGLLQNLTATQAEDGHFEVVAGGRRLAALQLLAARNALPARLQVGIPCRIVAIDDALEASAAENTVRERMHPADEFDAFKAMVDNGKPIADVAAHFGVADIVVKQRLKLANIAPDLIELYRKDEIELEQLQALAITDDHDAQRQVWKSATRWNRDPDDLRRALTKADVSADSTVAKFVGVDAYIVAGGNVRRDLFGGPEDVYLTDGKLLDKLALDKLEQVAQAERDAGWSWAEASLFMDYAKQNEYPTLPVPDADPEFASKEDAERAEAIKARITEIEGIDQDEYDDSEELQEEFSSLHNELEEIEDRMVEVYPNEVKATAGVLVYLTDHRGLTIDRGRLRPGQTLSKAGAVGGKAKPAKNAKTAKPKKPELSAAILTTLSAHRNARAKTIIACHPMLALCMLVDRLIASMRANHGGVSNCIGIGQVPSGGQPAPHGTQISKKLTEALKLAEDGAFQGVPRKDVLAWLLKQPIAKVLEILAVLVAHRFHAITDRPEGHAMVAAIDTLIDEPGFIDLAEHWTPTTDDFLDRIHGDLVAEAVTEAAGKDAAATLRGLKKAERTATAAKLLAGTGWLPKPLRSPTYALKGATAKETPAKAKKPAKKAAAKKAPAKGKKSAAPAKKAVKKVAKKAPAKKPAKKAGG